MQFGFYFGRINENGEMILDKESQFYRFKNLSVLDSEKCRNCIQLPMCMGGCKYSRYKDINVCNELIPNGMNLYEKIKLHYYSDLKFNIKEIDYI